MGVRVLCARRSRLVTVALAAWACTWMAEPAQAAAPAIGIGENNDAVFADPLFSPLGIKHVRVVVSYDVVAAAARGDDELERVMRYLAGAAAGGQEPLVAFEHARGDARACVQDPSPRQCRLPPDEEYERSFRAFRERFPHVRAYTPWNEPNHQTQPTASRPEAAARFSNIVARACAGCTVVLGDVLDQADRRLAAQPTYRSTTRWIRRFRDVLEVPRDTCGLHNYSDVNRARFTGTRALMRALGCRRYWLTETGGIVESRGLAHDPDRQLRAMRRLLRMAGAEPLIERVYLYTWFGGVTPTWDSGLVLRRADGTTVARPAYELLRRVINGAEPPPAPVASEVSDLAEAALGAWADLQVPENVFPNPALAEVAKGFHGFAPPMLMYALQRTGERTGRQAWVEQAGRAWPNAVAPSRASPFDVIATAYALRDLTLVPEQRDRLLAYLAAYTPKHTGAYDNLRLVEALAAIAATNAGVPSPWLDEAIRTVNELAPRVARGSGYLSDPGSAPLGYHALSTLMLAEAVQALGPRASAAARHTARATVELLSRLVAPDGAADYLGRGQGNVWIPAVTAAAMLSGARLHPTAAGRYVAVARLALARLRALHLTPDRGFRVVPGDRTTVLGLDPYVHTVAYNGLALWALTLAGEPTPPAPAVTAPAEGRLLVREPRASGLGVVATGETWLAVRALRRLGNRDLRSGFGLLALKIHRDGTWRDLIAPRPLVKGAPYTPAPSRGVPGGTTIAAAGNALTVTGSFGARRARFGFRALGDGAELTVAPVRSGERYRLHIYTRAGTGRWGARRVDAFGARWRFSAPVSVRRVPGFHAGPIEHLDALVVDARPISAGRLTIRISG